MANLTLLLFFVLFALASVESKHVSKRMVGGSEAREGQFPYQVSLFDLPIGHFCGGSILNEKWILTAARCVQGKHVSSFYVAAGITNLLDTPFAIYYVNEVAIDNSSNIALVKLKDPLRFSANLNKIDLPTQDMNVVNASVVISGWGARFQSARPSKSLQYLQSKIYDLNNCKTTMATLPKYPPVTDSNLCTFSRRGEGLCNGDSGNPVVSGNYQVGVSLYGYPCAKGYPDINANLWNYVDWIKSRISEE